MSRISELHGVGQSIWFDYIERHMVQSGELKKLVDAGLRGVTSNPTIFQQAITKSDAYEGDLHRLVNSEIDSKTIFEQLEIADIQAAADVLQSVYDQSDRCDGFVSIEVAPDLAYDCEATVAEARRLHAAVNRPNVMIKVPATREGIGAIRRLIGDGINVNVTLIFALERYAAVKEAYLSGLEDRLEQNLPVNHISSVASFFISRVDSNVDGQLQKVAVEQPGQAELARTLLGKIAVANAKLAYRQFQEVFSGDRWSKLADAGAQLQRPLWASTSTKNPDYPELLYVEPLMGPHTVNTMPPNTLSAFRDHGKVERTIDAGVDAARKEMADLARLGINMEKVTADLEDEGVQKFADSYEELLRAIGQRRNELVQLP